jgi:hypothetical protein
VAVTFVTPAHVPSWPWNPVVVWALETWIIPRQKLILDFQTDCACKLCETISPSSLRVRLAWKRPWYWLKHAAALQIIVLWERASDPLRLCPRSEYIGFQFGCLMLRISSRESFQTLWATALKFILGFRHDITSMQRMVIGLCKSTSWRLLIGTLNVLYNGNTGKWN